MPSKLCGKSAAVSVRYPTLGEKIHRPRPAPTSGAIKHHTRVPPDTLHACRAARGHAALSLSEFPAQGSFPARASSVRPACRGQSLLNARAMCFGKLEPAERQRGFLAVRPRESIKRMRHVTARRA